MKGVVINIMLNAVAKYLTEHGWEFAKSAFQLLRDNLPEETPELVIAVIDMLIATLPDKVAAGDNEALSQLEAELMQATGE